MAESTKNSFECLKEQSKDETNIIPDTVVEQKQVSKTLQKNRVPSKNIKVLPKDKTKIPEIKVQPIKMSTDSECTKNRISRNVAINRSFNSNSKLELLR